MIIKGYLRRDARGTVLLDNQVYQPDGPMVLPASTDDKTSSSQQRTQGEVASTKTAKSPHPVDANRPEAGKSTPGGSDGSSGGVLQSPLSSDCASPNSVTMESVKSEGHADDTDNSFKSSGCSSVESSPASTEDMVTSPMATSPPLTLTPHLPQSNNPPAKRRPGRPPGSTKRFKGPYAGPERNRRGATQCEEFSLRKFFEAGGRDYNEYLEWLKKKTEDKVTCNLSEQIAQTQTYTVKPVSPDTTHTVIRPPVAVATIPQNPYHQQQTAFQARAPLPPPYRPVIMPGSVPGRSKPPDLIHIRDIGAYSRATLPCGPTAIVSEQQSPQQQQLQQQSQHHHIQQQLQQQQQHHQQQQQQHHQQQLVMSDTCSGSPDALDLSIPRSADILDPLVPLSLTTRSPIMEIKPCPAEDASGSSRPNSRDNQRSPSDLIACSFHGIKSDINGNHTVIPNADLPTTTADMTTWDVDHVVRFVVSVPGCHEYAEAFREQRIDGATLPHLSDDHLTKIMKMKLGPAIRLRLALQQLK